MHICWLNLPHLFTLLTKCISLTSSFLIQFSEELKNSVHSSSYHPFSHTHAKRHTICPDCGSGLFINHSENEKHRQNLMKICVCAYMHIDMYVCLAVFACCHVIVTLHVSMLTGMDYLLMCLSVCVFVCVFIYNARLSAVSLCSLHDSTPAVSSLGTTGGWEGSDINTATNPCRYFPFTPLLMTTHSPFPTMCYSKLSGYKFRWHELLGVHICSLPQEVFRAHTCLCTLVERMQSCEQRGWVCQMLCVTISFHAPLVFYQMKSEEATKEQLPLCTI